MLSCWKLPDISIISEDRNQKESLNKGLFLVLRIGLRPSDFAPTGRAHTCACAAEAISEGATYGLAIYAALDLLQKSGYIKKPKLPI